MKSPWLPTYVSVVARWLIVSAFLLPSLLHAQAATGAIEGPVFNPANGQYVERARITIDGTSLEAFTDADGNFRPVEIAGPSTPPHAQLRQRTDFGSLWTFGLKARF